MTFKGGQWLRHREDVPGQAAQGGAMAPGTSPGRAQLLASTAKSALMAFPSASEGLQPWKGLHVTSPSPSFYR